VAEIGKISKGRFNVLLNTNKRTLKRPFPAWLIVVHAVNGVAICPSGLLKSFFFAP